MGSKCSVHTRPCQPGRSAGSPAVAVRGRARGRTPRAAGWAGPVCRSKGALKISLKNVHVLLEMIPFSN